MILFKLICKDCEIYFDSWFSSSREYEKLKKKKFLNCYNCNSLKVEKALMSPNILKLNNKTKSYKQDSKHKKINLEYQNFISKNFDYVGKNFAYEARSIYYKSKKTTKGIYGIASKQDLVELKEEGIEVKKISWAKNNIN